MSKIYVLHYLSYDSTKPWRSESVVLGVYRDEKKANDALAKMKEYFDIENKYFEYNAHEKVDYDTSKFLLTALSARHPRRAESALIFSAESARCRYFASSSQNNR